MRSCHFLREMNGLSKVVFPTEQGVYQYFIEDFLAEIIELICRLRIVYNRI